MIESRRIEVFHCDVHRVWTVVTSLQNYAWRSDLESIEIIDDKTFIEKTKDGYKTKMTTTHFEPYKCWEFDIENENMSGHWKGDFIDEENQTKIIFTEMITMRKKMPKFLIKLYLKKQQSQYMKDLHKEISKQNRQV